jgi:hypothetical protein
MRIIKSGGEVNMMNSLVSEIRQQTNAVIFQNIQIILDEIKDVEAVPRFSDMPYWKHIYHMLHSLDQWFVNPNKFEEPDFHTENLNSLFVSCDRALKKEELQNYFNSVKKKIDNYLSELSDEELGDNPEDCMFSRLALILGQYRHASYHMGLIHSFIRDETGKWLPFKGLPQFMQKNEKKD